MSKTFQIAGVTQSNDSALPGSVPPLASPVAPPARSKHRPEIQGLRALLMVQVLLFHAWTVGSPIGVDAFILISAYLMTSSFVRRSESGHVPFFVERWANTFKRLIPPLAVVVAATLGAGFWILPKSRWHELVTQAFASMTYWENIRLADVSADYFADDHALASPFQHLWSMSMQGQMFILWPLVMTAAVLIARKLNVSIRKTVLVAFSAVAVASLVWLLLQGGDDGSIYFDTRARIWEFAFGSAIAAAAPWLRLPDRLAGWVASLGLATIILFSLVSIGSYPGPMAFFPMAATSAVLLYTPAVSAKPIRNLLRLPPLVGLGNISYAVYLVHWPIFVLFLFAVGDQELTVPQGLALIVASILVAWALTKFVDDPLREWPWANRTTWHKITVAGVALVLGLLPVTFAHSYVRDAERKQVEALRQVEEESTKAGSQTGEEVKDALVPASGPGSDSHPGARALLGGGDFSFAKDPIPGPLVEDEWATWGGECSQWVKQRIPRDKNSVCTAFESKEDLASKRVLVVGNSHAQQLLLPAVQNIMETNGWSGEAILKGACSFGMPDAFEGDCVEHNQTVLDYIDEESPDYVFLVVTRTTTDSPDEYLVPGVVELVQELTDRGVQVVGITDNPRSEQDLYECSSERDPVEPYGGCLLDQQEYLGPQDLTALLQDIEGFHLIDMRDAFCADGVCPTIIGNVFVYMDANHVSVPYSQTMVPFFVQRFADFTG